MPFSLFAMIPVLKSKGAIARNPPLPMRCCLY
jgi:hypothetical protein